MLVDVQHEDGMVSIARVLYEQNDTLGVQFLRKINVDTYDFNINTVSYTHLRAHETS